MSGFVAEGPEIVYRFNNASAEQMRPNTVSHHSRGQRIVATDHPRGELCATAVVGIEFGVAIKCEYDRNPAWHFGSEILYLTANVDFAVRRVLRILNTHDGDPAA